MRLRCAVLDDFQQVATEIADWSPVADDVDVVSYDTHFPDEDALAAALSDADIVVTLRERVPFPGSLLARLPRLKLLVASGMRNSVIDYAAAEARGITVCGTASSSAPPVELTWALLLGLARGIVQEGNGLRAGGPWQQTVGADLNGRRLGLLGLGKIGGRVAQVGLAFGMRVSAWSQNLTRERTDEVGVELARSKEELLSSADFVSVHLALGERTRGLLGPPNWPCSSRPPTWSTPRARRSSTRRRCSPRCTRAASPARAWTSSTPSRCPPAIRCAPPRACSRHPTWAMSRAPTTPRTTARPSRRSRPTSRARPYGGCPCRRPRHRTRRRTAQAEPVRAQSTGRA